MLHVPPIHFGIRIATYPRNGQTKKTLPITLQSVLRQNYRHWTIYLVGDLYEPADELIELASIIPANKLKLRNVDVGTERNRFPQNLVKFCGGVNVTNYALDWMQADGVKHVAILDDDDIWYEDHLRTIVEGYNAFPQAQFIYTQGTHTVLGEVPKKACPLTWNNYPPQPNNVLHSAVSWRLDLIPLRYVNTVAKNLKDKRGEYFYGDAYMWVMMQRYFEKHGLNSLYIPKNTLYHDGI